MNIQIRITKENSDGSAEATATYDREALEYMIEYAIVGMLKEYIEKSKKENQGAKVKRKPRSKAA